MVIVGDLGPQGLLVSPDGNRPGDVISTGTPAGVGIAMKPPGLLKAGDVVRIEIEGIGVLENPVIDEPDSTAIGLD